MPRFVSWASPLLIVTALVAQQGPPVSAPATPATAAERLAALKADQKKMMDEWEKAALEFQAKAKAAQAAGKPLPAMVKRPDFAPLVKTAQQAALDFAGTDDAVPFLLFAVMNSTGEPDDLTAALDTLTVKHLDHADIARLGQLIGFLPSILPADKAKVFLGRFAKSANADVRSWATFAAHQETIEKADRDGKAYQAAKAALQQAIATATDAQLKSEIQDAIDTREKFGTGNLAPDIEGTDLDGVAFKLSDYKGKVVFLDFWGDW